MVAVCNVPCKDIYSEMCSRCILNLKFTQPNCEYRKEPCFVCHGVGKGKQVFNSNLNKWERDYTRTCTYCNGDGYRYYTLDNTSGMVAKKYYHNRMEGIEYKNAN
jgi:DnaJ-class molecular chaperone